MALSKLRLEYFEEGLCAQVMHIGPYATEPATIERMREFMKENRYRNCVGLGGKHHEIYVGDPRKADPAFDELPNWSPDGTKIAFTSNGDVYVMKADGGNPTRLTDNPKEDAFRYWSPDGKKIAFQSNRDGNWDIYVMNPDGSNPTRLTKDSSDNSVRGWSPDGKQIAFTSNRDGNNEIYVMNADASRQTHLTDNLADDGNPSLLQP